MVEDWEKRVYARYVSVHSLNAIPTPELLYGPAKLYIEKVISEHFPPDKTSFVLELACGSAPFIYFLRQNGYLNLSGVDISPEQVALAHAVGLENEVRLGDMVAYLDGVGPEQLDVVILFDILEHFSRSEQFEIMDRVFSRLKSDGRCILHVPNSEGLFGARVQNSDITHKSAFTRRSLTQLLKTVGFEEVMCFEDKPIPHGLLSLFRRLIWEISAFGQVILIGAETGNIRRSQYILSQNMLAAAKKVPRRKSNP